MSREHKAAVIICLAIIFSVDSCQAAEGCKTLSWSPAGQCQKGALLCDQGNSCNKDGPYCKPGLYCSGGQCSPLIAQGEACSHDQDCLTGLCSIKGQGKVCEDPSDSVCVPGTSTSCGASMFCDQTGGNPSCERRKSVNGVCSVDKPRECLGGLTCVPADDGSGIGTCQELFSVTQGNTCLNYSTIQCSFGLACRNGICTDFVNEQCSSNSDCGYPEGYCDCSTSESQTCQPLRNFSPDCQGKYSLLARCMANRNCEFESPFLAITTTPGGCMERNCREELVSATCCGLQGFSWAVGHDSALGTPLGADCSDRSPATYLLVVLILTIALGFVAVTAIAYRKFSRAEQHRHRPVSALDPWDDDEDYMLGTDAVELHSRGSGRGSGIFR